MASAQISEQDLRKLLLIILDVLEESLTVELYLKDKGLVDPVGFEAARAKVSQGLQAARTSLETQETTDRDTLLALLKNYKGPIQ